MADFDKAPTPTLPRNTGGGRRSGHPSGFTLLELILAAAIVATISLTIYNAMAVGFRTRAVVERQTSRTQVAAAVFDIVDRDLQSVMTLPSTTAADGTESAAATADITFADAFTGLSSGPRDAAADEVTFVTLGRDPSSTSVHADGPRRIRLALSGDTLIRQEQSNLLSSSPTEPPEEILARHVRSLSLSYYDGQTWSDDWDSASLDNALPLAVKVTIAFDTGNNTVQSATRTIPIANGTDVTQTEATPSGSQGTGQ